ncbi:MAG: MFS transporter [Gemmatimonadetes bacterium]|jgi:MFS family permease|nr:MFS transporter [Gemmatimonadota bacterium]
MKNGVQGRASARRPKNLRGNVWKFYVFKAFWGLSLGLVVPVLVLYFLARGFLLAEFMILMSVMNISLFAFEIPTGIIADRFSRKWSVCSGTLFLGISVLAMLGTVHFPLLILIFLLWGVGESLVSGADSAFLYDSLKAAGMEDAFQRIIGNAISLQLAAVVSGTLLCGILVDQFGLSASLWASSISLLLAAMAAFLFEESPFLDEALTDDRRIPLAMQVSSYYGHLRESLQFVIHSREMLALIFINVVVLRLCFLTERPFSQPYLSSLGYDPEEISYLHTIFYGITALSAKYSHAVARLLGNRERNSLFLISALGIVSLVAMVHSGVGSVVVSAIVGIYLMKGLFEPFMQNSLNRRLDSAKRASCLSIARMGNNFLGIFLGPLFGYLADVSSLKSSLSIFQWMFVLLLVVCTVSGWRMLGQAGGGEEADPE